MFISKMIVWLVDFGFFVFCCDFEGYVIFCDDYMGYFYYFVFEVLKKMLYDLFLFDMWSVGVVLYFMVYVWVFFVGDEEFILF